MYLVRKPPELEPENRPLTTRGTDSIPRMMTMKNGVRAMTWPKVSWVAAAVGRLIKKLVRTEEKAALFGVNYFFGAR
jgi:hypothetical protein